MPGSPPIHTESEHHAIPGRPLARSRRADTDALAAQARHGLDSGAPVCHQCQNVEMPGEENAQVAGA
jgi:hypothetical protein